MPTVLTGKIEKLDIKETMRYLGFAGVKSAEGMEELLSECENLILPVLAPKAVYEVYPLTRCGGEALDLGFARVNSHSLYINLRASVKVALFAATVGAGVDRLILKYNKLSPARAVVLQAMGAAAVEQWCDEVNGIIKAKYIHTRPRFSCGYGDLPLALQREIFPALSVTKNIGVTLTEGDLMMPSKSVTAIIGIEEESVQ